jgi:short-subunit dehydrogenase
MSTSEYYHEMTAIVTGASSGLGEEFARQLSPIVGKLILVARRMDRLEALRSELLLKYPSLEVTNFRVDLGDESARMAFIDQMLKEAQPIDILINNAGLGDIGNFRSSDWMKIQTIVEVNMAALTHLTHAFLPGMLERRKGGILNIASITAILPAPKLAVYAATKSYVANLSEALRVELRGTGVRVTTVCPGPVETEFGLVASRKQKKKLPVPNWVQVTPQQVVRDSLRAFAKDRARVFPGIAIRAFALSIAMIPMFILRRILERLVRK